MLDISEGRNLGNRTFIVRSSDQAVFKTDTVSGSTAKKGAITPTAWTLGIILGVAEGFRTSGTTVTPPTKATKGGRGSVFHQTVDLNKPVTAPANIKGKTKRVSNRSV